MLDCLASLSLPDMRANLAWRYLSLYEMRSVVSVDPIIMAVRSYCDGSGTTGTKDKTGKYVVFGCHAAPSKIWGLLETDWNSVLSRHFKDKRLRAKGKVVNFPYLHMKEAMPLSRSGLYTKGNGWDEQKVMDLVIELALIFRKFWHRNLVSTVSWLTKDEYRDAKLKNKKLMRMGTCLAMPCCQRIFASLVTDITDRNATIEMFHDWGEKFLSDLDSDRRNPKKCEQEPILERINGIDSVDMKKTPGIQMADLLAWTMHRCLTTKEDGRAQDLWAIMSTRNVIHHYPIQF